MTDPSMRRAFAVAAVLFAAALAPTAAAQKIEWQDLVLRPDLWPAECKMARQVRTESEKLDRGDTVPVRELGIRHVTVVTPGGALVTVEPDETDVLKRVQREWRRMSTEQRELSYERLAERADVWPDHVKLAQSMSFRNGDQLERGTELTLLRIDGDELLATREGANGAFRIPANMTDVIQRARELLEDDHDRPGRIERALDGKLVSLPSGESAALDFAEGPRYLALYFSAGWCGPCREFSPKLVEFYAQHEAAGERFEVIFVSGDRSAEEMAAYAKAASFPWLAVGYEHLEDLSVLDGYRVGGIPQLLVVDRHGRVFADSYDREQYIGPDAALAKLKQLLD